MATAQRRTALRPEGGSIPHCWRREDRWGTRRRRRPRRGRRRPGRRPQRAAATRAPGLRASTPPSRRGPPHTQGGSLGRLRGAARACAARGHVRALRLDLRQDRLRRDPRPRVGLAGVVAREQPRDLCLGIDVDGEHGAADLVEPRLEEQRRVEDNDRRPLEEVAQQRCEERKDDVRVLDALQLAQLLDGATPKRGQSLMPALDKMGWHELFSPAHGRQKPPRRASCGRWWRRPHPRCPRQKWRQRGGTPACRGPGRRAR
eukprot:6334403-Prymnesium_polylepis.3